MSEAGDTDLKERLIALAEMQIEDELAYIQAADKAMLEAASLLESQERFIEFVVRWAWDKEGNGSTDTERLDSIRWHPVVQQALAARTAKESGE